MLLPLPTSPSSFLAPAAALFSSVFPFPEKISSQISREKLTQEHEKYHLRHQEKYYVINLKILSYICIKILSTLLVTRGCEEVAPPPVLPDTGGGGAGGGQLAPVLLVLSVTGNEKLCVPLGAGAGARAVHGGALLPLVLAPRHHAPDHAPDALYQGSIFGNEKTKRKISTLS